MYIYINMMMMQVKFLFMNEKKNYAVSSAAGSFCNSFFAKSIAPCCLLGFLDKKLIF